MDSIALIIILRLLHVVIGAFWFGGVIITAFFLLPTVRATGPIGGQFVGALMQRTHLADVLIWAGVVTVVSGALLYWNFYAGAPLAGPTLVYMVGAIAALIALGLGFAIARPTAARLGATGKAIQAQGAPPTPAQAAERDTLMARLSSVAAINAALLIVTVSCMAIGRYV
jgi:uncharacterized membrane protein